MTGIPSWESYPLDETSTAVCEHCGKRRATSLCIDHKATNPPRQAQLCRECADVERGRDMAIGLREYLRGFPEHPTDDDFRALAHLKFLGEEGDDSDPDQPSA